jgi:hypothetical protein
MNPVFVSSCAKDKIEKENKRINNQSCLSSVVSYRGLFLVLV